MGVKCVILSIKVSYLIMELFTKLLALSLHFCKCLKERTTFITFFQRNIYTKLNKKKNGS